MSDQRIVIADDQESIRDLYGRALSKIPDLSVDFAVDGVELVSKVEAYPGYKVVVSDFQMPRMNGLEATRKIREIGYKGPVILVSSDKFPEEELTRFQVDACLQKPIDVANITNVIRGYLD